MKDIFDGIEVNVKVTGTIRLDIKLTEEHFQKLSPSAQVWILEHIRSDAFQNKALDYKP